MSNKNSTKMTASFCLAKTRKKVEKILLSAIITSGLAGLTACGGDETPGTVAETPPPVIEPATPIAPISPAIEPVTPIVPIFTSKTSEKFPSNLFSVISLKDESYAFASVSDAVVDGVTVSPGAVVAVLKKEGEEWNVLHYIAVNSVNKNGLRAFGLALTPDESVLAVALNNMGIGLLDVQAAIRGDAVPTYVGLYTGYTNRGNGPGSIAIVAASDNKHLFVADEYGEYSGSPGVGDVAVVSYSRGQDGIVNGQRLGYVRPGQNSIAGLNISPDGKTLYIPSQISAESDYLLLNGINNPSIGKQCKTSYSGSISVVDVDNLIALADINPGDGNRVLENVIQAKVAAGCNAVRVAVSRDGKTVWSTARGDNLVHAYDAHLLKTSPNSAYLYSFSSNGYSPVGISSFGNDKYLAVTNSNRFGAVDENGNPLTANISIFDVSSRGEPKLLQVIESGEFPRDIYRNFDDRSVFVVNWGSGTFQEIFLTYSEPR